MKVDIRRVEIRAGWFMLVRIDVGSVKLLHDVEFHTLLLASGKMA